MMAGSARAISIRPTGPALLAGASAGRADATQIEMANPIAAITWIYLGSHKRIRTQNLKSSGGQHKKSGMNQIEAVKEVFPHAQPDLL
jgi:hypothetical protein